MRPAAAAMRAPAFAALLPHPLGARPRATGRTPPPGRTPAARRTPPAAAARPGRPSAGDAARLARGDAARTRGTGSRAVPHRLDAAEAAAFARARAAGFLTVRGSGVRRARKGSPLANAWRMACDARAAPAVVLRLREGGRDEVVVDAAPLRGEGGVDVRARLRAAGEAAGAAGVVGVEEEGWALLEPGAELGGEPVRWADDPTWRLPDVTITWTCESRPAAKALAAALADACERFGAG